MTTALDIGVSGAHRDACVAVAEAGRIVAVCAQERVVRSPGIGVLAGGFPRDALAAITPAPRASIERRFATAEAAILPLLPIESELSRHHEAHAALALSYVADTSTALACVCDRHDGEEVTFWERRDAKLRLLTTWSRPGFATALLRAAPALGFTPDRLGRFEALARTARPLPDDRLERLVRLEDDGLAIDDRWEAILADTASNDQARRASVAAAVEAHLQGLLLRALARVRAPDADAVALGGGLFHNTAFCSAVADSGLFRTVAVPIDPGNGGLAAGTLLRLFGARGPIGPFLGPSIDVESTKAVLDNCKLSYDYVHDDEILGRVVHALRRGLLVGRVDGPMEWGRRALGNRSIFADPFAPFVLENLNRFLKQRDPYVSYGLIVCEEDMDRYFVAPRPSPFMQFEFELKDPDSLCGFLPPGVRRVRVQTVAGGASWTRRLLEAFGASGHPRVLVNTSFNGGREPIVCTARDAVRVFYGTGLDVLLIGNFILQK